jgi:hypothetical protein
MDLDAAGPQRPERALREDRHRLQPDHNVTSATAVLANVALSSVPFNRIEPPHTFAITMQHHA